MAREISDRAIIEKSQDKTFRDKVNHLSAKPGPLIHLDTSGVVLDLNEGAAKILGKSIKELVGSSIFHYIPEKLAEMRKINFDRIKSSGQSDSFLEEY